MSARVIVFVLALSSLTLGAAYAAALTPQTSNERGVSVEVKPHPVTPDGTLAFDIALNTHSGALSEDLTKSAVLVADGKAHEPAAWNGDAPGGHHRKGVLTFKPISPKPKAIELKLQRPGESAPRLFRWTLQ